MKLRQQLFALLLLSGIVPLAISSFLLIRQNRELLETQEKGYLTRSARFLSVELDGYLGHARSALAQLGESIAADPAGGRVSSRLRQSWLADLLQRFLTERPELLALRVLDAEGVGPQYSRVADPETMTAALDAAFEEARTIGSPVYRLVVVPSSNRPVAVLAVPVAAGAGEPSLVVEGAVLVRPMETFFSEEGQGDVAVFVIDRAGAVLWSHGAEAETVAAVADSSLVSDFVRFPLNLTAEHTLSIGGRRQRLVARISPIAESGWGVVVQKPLATAFGVVQQMILKTAISTGLLVVVAMAVAVAAASRLSLPIQRLAETTHEMAAGNFGRRVDLTGLGPEIAELATDFNRMGNHVQRHVARLEEAAQTNRDLFIGSMRAFAAAIDAKDPYTKGHSERVAAISRTIAKFLGRDDAFQHQVWVGALLHDVGKLGVDDRILGKGGVLTAEEYEEMKRHPAIGAEIMSRIEQLEEMLPAIRWHHEAWNGHGYPDGLAGEQIPLIARIVAVADTFDAITTSRPYQRAYQPAVAVETIRKLAGVRFDAKIVTAFLLAFEANEIRVRPVAVPDLESPTAMSA